MLGLNISLRGLRFKVFPKKKALQHVNVTFLWRYKEFVDNNGNHSICYDLGGFVNDLLTHVVCLSFAGLAK